MQRNARPLSAVANTVRLGQTPAGDCDPSGRAVTRRRQHSRPPYAGNDSSSTDRSRRAVGGRCFTPGGPGLMRVAWRLIGTIPSGDFVACLSSAGRRESGHNTRTCRGDAASPRVAAVVVVKTDAAANPPRDRQRRAGVRWRRRPTVALGQVARAHGGLPLRHRHPTCERIRR